MESTKRIRNKNTPEFCTVEGCNRKHSAKGFCNIHYRKYKYDTNLLTGCKKCTIYGCDRNYYAKDLCRKHYALSLRNGKPEKKAHQCKYPGCKNTCIINDYCSVHKSKADTRLKHGLPVTTSWSELFSGERNPRWSGGNSDYQNHGEMKRIRKQIIIDRGGKCEFCGGEGSQVHHLDGSKDNHNPKNLILCCHKCHMSIFHSGPRKKRVKEEELVYAIP